MYKKSEGNNLHRKIKNRQGFTLAELLVVVAIIAILAMISIPVFASRLEDSRKNTCLYNRETFHRLLRTEMALGDKTEKEVVETVVEAMGCPKENITSNGDGSFIIEDKCFCPSGGKFQISAPSITGSHSYTIRCSAHGRTTVETINVHHDRAISLLLNSDIFKSYFATRPSASLDSTGPNFGGTLKAEFVKELKEDLGLDDEFDFRIWRDSNGYKIYISEPLANKKPGQTVKVTGYHIKPDGTKIVGKEQDIKLGEQTQTSAATNKPVTFNVMLTGDSKQPYRW